MAVISSDLLAIDSSSTRLTADQLSFFSTMVETRSADSSGINSTTGALLTDWAHTEQSIRCILTTPIGSRIMRRTFGSNLPDLVDSKMISENILAVYSAAAEAIEKWEPRFLMRAGGVQKLGATGQIELIIRGTYFPRGHLGDFTVAEDATTRVVFEGTI